MTENQIAYDAPAAEAATGQAETENHAGYGFPAAPPASPTNLPSEDPVFGSAAEEEAYWKGVSSGIRQAGREPGHPHMPANFDLSLTRSGAGPGLTSSKLLDPWPHIAPDETSAGNTTDGPILPGTGRGTAGTAVEGAEGQAQSTRAIRADGWTAPRQRLFLEVLAGTGVVADACRASGMSRDAAYAFRRRASGRAFALAWDAALLIARGRVSDEVMSRSVHGVIDRVYRNGELVAERHRYDNRLTMAVLTRLDRQAEGLGEGADVARAIAQEYDRFLDLLPQGVEGAEEFVTTRFPTPSPACGRGSGRGSVETPPAPPSVDEPPSSNGLTPTTGTEAALLARLSYYERRGVGLPTELDVEDLDPEEMQGWTEEQWDRAHQSGLLRMLCPSEWPEAARAAGADETNGMCKLRKLYRFYNPKAAAAEEAQPEDDFANCEVWQEEEGRWLTNFPPPARFEGWQEGAPGTEDYAREPTQAELETILRRAAGEEALEAALLDQRISEEAAARDRFFGLAPTEPRTRERRPS